MTDPFLLLAGAVLAPLALAALCALAGPALRARTAWLALAGAGLSLGLLLRAASLSAWGASPIAGQRPWVEAIGLAWAFRLDGLSLFYGLVVTGVGALVLAYGRWYLGDSASRHGAFYALMLAFMASMLGTVLADDLLLLFVFWELTGVTSFLLIGFQAGESKAAAYGARRALLVTLGTGLGLFAAALLLKAGSGATRLQDLFAAASGPQGGLLLGLMLLAAFGKSAQFPFHFWLPGAMEAPTPVSAYLHSATMVKLGVFLAGLLYPAFHGLPLWSPALLLAGGASLWVGALGAHRRDDLKAVLAYTTIAQLGALLLWYGLAPLAGLPRAEALGLLLVLGHVLYKGSLFLSAGVVQHAAHTRDLRAMGGLAKALPLTALASGLAAASLAGLPATLGFLGKETLLEAALVPLASGAAWAWLLLAVLLASSALYLATALRLAMGPFFSPAPAGAEAPRAQPLAFQALPLFPAAAGLWLGLSPGGAGAVLGTMAGGGPLELRAWHGLNAGLGLSLLAWAAGAWLWRARTPSRAPRVDLGAAFDAGVQGLLHFAAATARFIRMDRPAEYLGIIIAAFAALLGLALLPGLGPLPAGAWTAPSLLDGLSMALMAGAALGVVLAKRWTTRLISLSTAGFLVCFYFMQRRAPDLALTQMLVESATLVFMLLLLGRFPDAAQESDAADDRPTPRKAVSAGLAAATGAAVFLLALEMTAAPHAQPMGRRFPELTLPLAHGANAVNTVLVDFRGFDTMFEITVLVVAALGSLGLLLRPRARKGGRP